jgi:hypothetical protein
MAHAEQWVDEGVWIVCEIENESVVRRHSR